MISLLAAGFAASIILLQTFASPEKSIDKFLPKSTAYLQTKFKSNLNTENEWSRFPENMNDYEALLHWKTLIKVKSFNNALYEGNLVKLTAALESGIKTDFWTAIQYAASIKRFDIVVKIAQYSDSLALSDAFYKLIFVADDSKYLDLLLKSTKGNAESENIAINQFLGAIKYGRVNAVSTFLDYIDYMTQRSSLKELLITKGLLTAYNHGQNVILRMLMARSDISARGNAILKFAVDYGYVNLVKILLNDKRVLLGGFLAHMLSLSTSTIREDVKIEIYDSFWDAIQENRWLRISDGQSQEILEKWISTLDTGSRKSLLLLALSRYDHVLTNAIMKSLDLFRPQSLYRFLVRYERIKYSKSLLKLMRGIIR